jgi:hypothetical protein
VPSTLSAFRLSTFLEELTAIGAPRPTFRLRAGPAPLLVRVLTAEARLLLPTLKKSPLAPKAAVATAFASADADYDNGAVALYGAPRYGSADERATRRIDSGCGNRQFFPSRAVPCGLLWPARLIRRNARAIHPPFIALCFDVPWSNTLG